MLAGSTMAEAISTCKSAPVAAANIPAVELARIILVERSNFLRRSSIQTCSNPWMGRHAASSLITGGDHSNVNLNCSHAFHMASQRGDPHTNCNCGFLHSTCAMSVGPPVTAATVSNFARTKFFQGKFEGERALRIHLPCSTCDFLTGSTRPSPPSNLSVLAVPMPPYSNPSGCLLISPKQSL